MSPRLHIFRREALGYQISCALLLTRDLSILIDTLLGPADMGPVKQLLSSHGRGRPLVIVNTHYHWDHVWGNCAFPGTTVIGHALCRELLWKEGPAELTSYHPRIRDAGPVEIALPTVTFADRLVLHGGDMTVELRHTPGHTADSIVAYVPEEELLLAGDTVEYPFPLLEWPGDAGHAADYLQQLGELERLAVRTVIPGHGPVSDARLVRANTRYVQTILDMVAEGRRRVQDRGEGREEGRGELPAIPLAACLEPWIDPDASGGAGGHLEKAHRDNVENVASQG